MSKEHKTVRKHSNQPIVIMLQPRQRRVIEEGPGREFVFQDLDFDSFKFAMRLGARDLKSGQLIVPGTRW